jgi:excisionase family DNA binding protein
MDVARIKDGEYLTAAQVAEQTGVTRRTVINWVNREDLPATKTVAGWLISQEALDEFVRPVSAKTPVKYAVIRSIEGRLTDDGLERVFVVRGGKKGRGKEYGRVVYRPWSGASCDSAYQTVGEIVDKFQLTIHPKHEDY